MIGAQTRFAGPNAIPGNDCTSATSRCPLDEAIALLQPGDTISIASGGVYPAVCGRRILVPNVALVGEGGVELPCTTSVGGFAMSIEASNVTLSDLKFSGGPQAPQGLSIFGAAVGAILTRVHVQGFQSGIGISSTNVRLLNCTFSDNFAGGGMQIFGKKKGRGMYFLISIIFLFFLLLRERSNHDKHFGRTELWFSGRWNLFGGCSSKLCKCDSTS